ncbi:MAG: ATP phosphoribosyltransferase [Actinobacteria bacterium]|nr:ATP phosphoribosyltransferase [Actinomycetota bacterium]MBL7060669.1 ATP phosphoribosyltransferase [Actinomycetota bacterium]
MKYKLSIVIPKGYLFNDCVNILKSAGYDISNLKEDSRKLIICSEKDLIRYIIARPMDVPVYVEHGACDIGFAGKDVLEEKESNVLEFLDLKSGICRVIVATLREGIEKVKNHYEHFGSIKVATKYPNIARKFFDKKGMQVEIIKLYGSVELAPLLGIADEILDITATGRTLRENNLVEMESVMVSTTRLIVNAVSYRLKHEAIDDFIGDIQKVEK